MGSLFILNFTSIYKLMVMLDCISPLVVGQLSFSISQARTHATNKNCSLERAVLFYRYRVEPIA